MTSTLALTRLPPEAQALRAPLRAFLDEALAGMPADRRARSWLGFDAAFSRELGRRGWIGLALPREYGGGGRGQLERFVVAEELLARGAPVSAHWIAERQSAPMILRCGSEAQKRWHVPRICRGESFFAIGMSEPQAGSDLASVRTRATRTADGWRLNGHKIWTTNGAECDHMIALVRTSGEPGDRHRGLSQLLIDLRTPGITVRPIEDLTGDRHFSEVFFDDVQLPHEALLGAEGEGWQQVNAELAYERSGPERIYSSIVLLDTWLAQLRARGDAGEAATALAGRLVAELATLRSLSLAVTTKLAAGENPMNDAVLVKDLGTGFEQNLPIAIAELLDASAAPVSDELARTLAYVTQFAPTFSLRGGTREILRGMIARGLGLR
ncbi:acyl-CoA dehydrogenase family protein [Ottowia sp.]|uniref:acyl-CoA dehydrogenase family protein n=1 Tax=Ottowia sp. TaxID=1898956 RepID=UPI002C4AC565|nr:acyl-CoA dehydrogenase family protein [Ottowia sp.]